MSAAAANGQHGTDLLRANVKGHAADIIAHGLGHRNMSNAEHHHAATTMTARSASELGATWCRRAARAVKQRLLDQQQLFREYQYIVALDDTIKHPQADALRTECAGRNRYANVLPYDYNRCDGMLLRCLITVWLQVCAYVGWIDQQMWRQAANGV